MKIRTLAKLDISNYQILPNYSTAETRALGGALVDNAPKQVSPLTDKSVLKLATQLELIDAAWADKQRATSSTDLAEDGEIDLLTDASWASARKGLERWQPFAVELMAELPKQPGARAKLLAARDKAERARVLHNRLFGKQGLRFTGLSYTEQVGEMRARLRVLKEDGLMDDLELLVGEETVAGLLACQDRYEDMVNARLVRDASAQPSFRELRRQARVRIVHYAGTILARLDEDEPESFDLLDCLQPLVTARRNYQAGRRGPAALLGEGEAGPEAAAQEGGAPAEAAGQGDAAE